MWKSLLFLGIVALARSETTNVLQCTENPGALPINTYLEGCVNPPCVLTQMTTAVIHVIFKAPHSMRNMTSLVTAYIMAGGNPVVVQYPLGSDAHTCNFLVNSYCPVMEGELLLYTFSMYISPLFPRDTLASLEFRVQDDLNNPIFCTRIGIRIAPRLQSITQDV